MNEDLIQICSMIADQLAARIEERTQVIPTLTLEQAAKALGISSERARQLCARGDLPHIRMDRLYRIKPQDVNDYLNLHYTGKGGRA